MTDIRKETDSLGEVDVPIKAVGKICLIQNRSHTILV